MGIIIDFKIIFMLFSLTNYKFEANTIPQMKIEDSNLKAGNYIYSANSSGAKLQGVYVNGSLHNTGTDSDSPSGPTESAFSFCNGLVRRFSNVLVAVQKAQDFETKVHYCKELLNDLQRSRERAIKDCKVYLLISSPRYVLLRKEHCPQLPDFVGEYKSTLTTAQMSSTESSIDSAEKADIYDKLEDEEKTEDVVPPSKSGSKRGFFDWYSGAKSFKLNCNWLPVIASLCLLLLLY